MKKLILLSAAVATAALIYNYIVKWKAEIPCVDPSDPKNHDGFVIKHVLNGSFNRSSKPDWESYLGSKEVNNKSLMCRVPVQSFIDHSKSDVNSICKTGKHLHNNLCISSSNMTIYEVETAYNNDSVCEVNRITPLSRPVIVACNIVAGPCLPVHFEPYKGQVPTASGCS